jgi:hypothetical protein
VKHIDIVSALQHLSPDAQYTIIDDQIIWECDLPQPTLAEIERVILLIENKLKRQSEYPPIGDQLDSLFHAGIFPEEMAAKLQAVKDAYPKSSEAT